MRRGRIVLIVILVCFIGGLLSALIYGEVDYKYRNMKQAYYQDKINRLNSFVRREKEWILRNQDSDGPIYMNRVESNDDVGDVNPYFACLAAQSILSGSVTNDELEQVGQYIKWHAERFFAEEGEISHYLLSEDGLNVHNKADSVDSYVAVFVSLLSDYNEKGGILEEGTRERIVDLSIDKLEELTKDGLTKVRRGSDVYYYMDNVEVLAAYVDMLNLIDNPEKRALVEKRIYAMEVGLSKMWDAQKQVYHIGVMDNGSSILTQNLKNLYPDGIVQIYNIAFDVYPKGQSHAQEQYQKFSQNINWKNMEYLREHDFYWTELLYIAAVMEDLDQAEIYLSKYEELLEQSRKYPFHTGTAGWSVKAGVKMMEVYEMRINQSLWDDYKNDRVLNEDE